VNQSEKIDLLVQALIKVQGELKPVAKNAENPYFKSSYADLAGIVSAAMPLLSKNNLAVIQTASIVNDKPALVTTLAHISGQWIKGEYPLVNAKPNDPQAQGASMTYARRYCFAAIVGIITEDDDGNSATEMNLKHVSKAPTPTNKGFGGASGF
jgi:hypothetical protein